MIIIAMVIMKAIFTALFFIVTILFGCIGFAGLVRVLKEDPVGENIDYVIMFSLFAFCVCGYITLLNLGI